MLLSDRRRCTARSIEQRRAALPLLQRARLAELEHEGWRLHCIRDQPVQVVLMSPKNRLLLLTVQGQLAEPMGVAVRHR